MADLLERLKAALADRHRIACEPTRPNSICDSP
jgi:hypothetical protein